MRKVLKKSVKRRVQWNGAFNRIAVIARNNFDVSIYNIC